MGYYYSLYEWYHPLYLSDPERYVVEHMIPQIKDLVTRYAPSILWTDGEWDHPSEIWKSPEILAWLLNEGPNPEEVVINDRWGKGIRNVHGGFYTTEYGEVGGGMEPVISHKWEECRGIGRSFGYNRNEDEEDYQKPRDLIHMLIDIVAKGGNLLLDVGPTGDGRIPVIMQQRLLEMGKWLEVNGEAIYATTPWKVSGEGETMRYTAKGETLYAISKGWPGKELVVQAPKPGAKTNVSLLGYDPPLKAEHLDDRVHIEVPPLSVGEAPCQHAFVFKLEPTA
jgi:alpha-L-fucosidase